ncbi:hypothetical protein LRS74_19925 [Streptomyces sp. LX-29]|uniref:hypothetical protein n=1 Tax=Streptomyces sp. LX-29 TaxID=2900152 RepID=UPI00240E9447|nr:hypothetical protein [Streptomyces sp. LX-29]WFB09055.1 hypothetical protein LRS74_19925 [Streptomyces sp. LX-29]
MGGVARRPVAAVAAVVLMAEALGIALLNWVLGLMVDRQKMSMGGMDPDAMSTGTWVMGGLFGLYLLFCGVTLLRTALRDRGPGRFARIVLISCAVVHGVLGALTVGLVGWTAFAYLMVVLGLIVLTLLAYDERREPGTPVKDVPGPPGDPGPEPV